MGHVFNTSFFLPFGKRNVDRQAAESAFVQDLICYDTVWILTDHMAAVGMLAGIMGPQALVLAMEQGAIRFVRDRTVIAWPMRPLAYGPTPPLSLMSIGHPDRSATFSTVGAGVLAGEVLREFGFGDGDVRRLAELTERVTEDFQYPPRRGVRLEDIVPGEVSRLELYRHAVQSLPGFPVTPRHLNKIIRDIRRGKRDLLLPSGTIGVVYTGIASGEALLQSTAPIERKQLAMIQLTLGDRFLEAMSVVPEPAVLHTDPMVETILRARVARVRHAAGNEVDDVLRAESVAMPVLAAPGPVDYARLLHARASASARAFRDVVDARDADAARQLLPEYQSTLNKAMAGRWEIRVVRWLALNALGGVLAGVPGALVTLGADEIVGKLLARREARYFIDTTLRRVAAGIDSANIVVRP